MTDENKRGTIEENKQLIACRLKYLRIKVGYATPTALARAHDLSVSSYQRWEKDMNMNMNKLYWVVDIHGMPLGEFMSLKVD